MPPRFAVARRARLAGLALLAPGLARGQDPDARLHYVTTARQLGPVGYRDPIGAISPDGDWIAFTSGGWLRLVRAAGGPVATLGPPAVVFRALAWLPDSRRLAALASDADGQAWWVFDIGTGERRPLWDGKERVEGTLVDGGGDAATEVGRFTQLVWSPDGTRVAGVVRTAQGGELWELDPDGTQARVRRSPAVLSQPAWAPDGRSVACLAAGAGPPRLSRPCGDAGGPEAYGPIAFSPDGATVYYATPNPGGTLDLWAQPTAGGRPQRLTRFTRDSYGPTVSRDGGILFGVQEYRTHVAVVPAEGGPARQVTAFQSETPSWSPDGRRIAVTYGTWRRVMDDAHYPDIAQEIGDVPADSPGPALRPRVIRASPSEDQGLGWSPNGRWLVLHSHAEGSDDLWLQPADGSAPARQITTGGHETGWPRWSPDGRWVAYGTEVREGPGPSGRGPERWRGALFVLGVDQTTGEITAPARRVPLEGFEGDVDQVEWGGGGAGAGASDSLVVSASLGLDQRALYLVARNGGTPRLVHRWRSEQRYSGLGVPAGGRWVAFVAPAGDGRFQIFRVPIGGAGRPTQLTFDPTDKTQPAVSPDGRWVAFTVFRFHTAFWRLAP